ncbi:hypothetical protein LX87_00141 [Larkinella arboricola]|uniref:Uncharacterized protein n=1 Tax=Larkinella arboricola TaxID=643671 RepID=A0A327X4S6_LARAB|nr:hypothetical protein LX87_00141 [Larkinella arboricola]
MVRQRGIVYVVVLLFSCSPYLYTNLMPTILQKHNTLLVKHLTD